jgi:PAS domain S-box-containing protein
MEAPRRPVSEADRLAALSTYDVLDTPPEQLLDDLAALAAHVCDAPISLISLVDEGREWFKSNICLSVTQMPRDISFSGHAILQPDLFIVPDAANDRRFADNPLVTDDPYIRFYAGATLSTGAGHGIGALCIMDRVPRNLSPSQQKMLQVLSRQVMAQLDARRQSRELVEREARLLRVFLNCPVAMAIYRWSDRIFVDLNTAFTTLFGWTRDDALGLTMLDLNILGADALAPLRAALDRLGTLRDEEITVRTRAGDLRQVLLGAQLLDLRQEPHIVTTFVDITARKQEEMASHRLAAIVESSDDAIIGKDLNGIVTSWNKGAESIFGYRAVEMVGTSIMRVIPGDRQGEERDILGAVTRGEGIVHLETLRRTKDGRLIDVSLTTSPIRDAAGTVIGASKVARDITQRRRAEEARRTSDARYRTLFEYAPDGILIADAEGYYLDANASICRMLGYTRDELIGLSPRDVVGESEVQHVEAAVNLVNADTEHRREWQLRRKDSSVFDADVLATKMPDGKILSIARDVTDRKRFEQALLQTNVELVGANRTKSEFLATMSHELRTPLNAIIGFSEVLGDGLLGEMTEQQRGFVGNISRSGVHLLALINDILDLSQVEAGKMTLDLDSVELSALLVNSLSDLREKAAKCHIQLDMSSAADVAAIQADLGKVKQIVHQLLSNAVKFTADGGRVTLVAGRVPRAEVGRLSGRWKGWTFPLADSGFEEFIRIVVSDNGIGISPDGLERLFKPFSQIDSGLARKFGGTGLGLAIVKILAELHGGTVAVESAVGEGSSFTVWLPFRPPEENAPM